MTMSWVCFSRSVSLCLIWSTKTFYIIFPIWKNLLQMLWYYKFLLYLKKGQRWTDEFIYLFIYLPNLKLIHYFTQVHSVYYFIISNSLFTLVNYSIAYYKKSSTSFNIVCHLDILMNLNTLWSMFHRHISTYWNDPTSLRLL